MRNSGFFNNIGSSPVAYDLSFPLSLFDHSILVTSCSPQQQNLTCHLKQLKVVLFCFGSRMFDLFDCKLKNKDHTWCYVWHQFFTSILYALVLNLCQILNKGIWLTKGCVYKDYLQIKVLNGKCFLVRIPWVLYRIIIKI